MRKFKNLRFELITFVLSILLASCLLSAGFLFALYVFKYEPVVKMSTVSALFLSFIFCVAIGTILSFIVSQRFLRAIRKLIDATNKVAKGDFNVRVDIGNSRGEFEQLLLSFNKMAEELGSTEMFRNDFINNFSHEFKTPIVSIRGFARHLLKDENLTPEQKKEYMTIIANESDRLSKMASNVLLLSKLENQKIISDKKYFYLDEQIRNCILLLEKQWMKKNIEFDLDLKEISIFNNEEILSHVWINLITNAIKFCNENGKITVILNSDSEYVTVSINDTGNGIDKNTINHIFDKFYQSEASHNVEGNGLGLSIVKRIIELCEGDICVISEIGKGTTFTIKLPIRE